MADPKLTKADKELKARYDAINRYWAAVGLGDKKKIASATRNLVKAAVESDLYHGSRAETLEKTPGGTWKPHAGSFFSTSVAWSAGYSQSDSGKPGELKKFRVDLDKLDPEDVTLDFLDMPGAGGLGSINIAFLNPKALVEVDSLDVAKPWSKIEQEGNWESMKKALGGKSPTQTSPYEIAIPQWVMDSGKAQFEHLTPSEHISGPLQVDADAYWKAQKSPGLGPKEGYKAKPAAKPKPAPKPKAKPKPKPKKKKPKPKPQKPKVPTSVTGLVVAPGTKVNAPAVLDQIALWKLDGDSYAAIAKKLDGMGVVTATGKQVKGYTVQAAVKKKGAKIIHNPKVTAHVIDLKKKGWTHAAIAKELSAAGIVSATGKPLQHYSVTGLLKKAGYESKAKGVKSTKKAEKAYYQHIKKNFYDPFVAGISAKMLEVTKANESWYAALESAQWHIAAQPPEMDPQLVADFVNQLEATHRKQSEKVFREALGVDVSKYMTQPAVREYLDGKIAENVALIKTIPNQFHTGLVNTISAYQATLPFDQEVLRSAIKTLYGKTGYVLRRLTRDQTNKMIGNLTQIRQTELGVTEYEWSTSADSRVRASHAEKDGKRFEWGNPPPDTGHPGHDIQCRCVALAIFSPENAAKLGGGPPPAAIDTPEPKPDKPPPPKHDPKVVNAVHQLKGKLLPGKSDQEIAEHLSNMMSEPWIPNVQDFLTQPVNLSPAQVLELLGVDPDTPPPPVVMPDPKPTPQPKPKAKPKRPRRKPGPRARNASKWVQTGPQAGSNPGGWYTTPQGKEYYVKRVGRERAEYETIANDLYRKAGIGSNRSAVVQMGDEFGVASPRLEVDEITSNAQKLPPDARTGFLVDAWLANWDVAEHGNLARKGRKAYRMDAGGALAYRATGRRKAAHLWTDDVQEFHSMRDAGKAHPAGVALFENLTQAELKAGIKKLIRVTDEAIDEIVDKTATFSEKTALKAKLKARKRSAIKQALREIKDLQGEQVGGPELVPLIGNTEQYGKFWDKQAKRWPRKVPTNAQKWWSNGGQELTELQRVGAKAAAEGRTPRFTTDQKAIIKELTKVSRQYRTQQDIYRGISLADRSDDYQWRTWFFENEPKVGHEFAFNTPQSFSFKEDTSRDFGNYDSVDTDTAFFTVRPGVGRWTTGSGGGLAYEHEIIMNAGQPFRVVDKQIVGKRLARYPGAKQQNIYHYTLEFLDQ